MLKIIKINKNKYLKKKPPLCRIKISKVLIWMERGVVGRGGGALDDDEK
jgi:hypothetical protein